MNSHNELWGSKKTDLNGKCLEQFIDVHNLAILNTGAFTGFNSVDGFFFLFWIWGLQLLIASKCSWKSHKEDGKGCNHCPMLIDY